MNHPLAVRGPSLNLIGVALFLGGCRTATPLGGSSIELLTPVSEAAPQSDRKLDFSAGIAAEALPPEPIGDLKTPVYPADALKNHPGTYVVNVTVTIDSNGLVSEVQPTWNRLNPPNPYSEELLAAVRTAALSWRFIPARHVYWRQNTLGEPVYDHADTVACETDLRFTFQPVDVTALNGPQLEIGRGYFDSAVNQVESGGARQADISTHNS